MLRRPLFTACAALALAAGPIGAARAGVLNPDISVIGQPVMSWTDDATSTARTRATLDAGGSEIPRSPGLLEGQSLNPYLNQEVQCS